MDIWGRKRSLSSASGTSLDDGRPRGEWPGRAGEPGVDGVPGGDEMVFIVFERLDGLEPYLRGGAKSSDDSVMESRSAEGVGRALLAPPLPL